MATMTAFTIMTQVLSNSGLITILEVRKKKNRALSLSSLSQGGTTITSQGHPCTLSRPYAAVGADGWKPLRRASRKDGGDGAFSLHLDFGTRGGRICMEGVAPVTAGSC